MANITIYEFEEEPDAQGELQWPASAVSTVATAETHNVAATTRCVVLTTDADGRVGFNVAAVASGMPILAAVPNFFRLRLSAGRTLRFA